MRRGAKPAKAKAEAKRFVARTSLKSEGSRVRDLEKRLAEAAEALEQQTATSEILKIISRSAVDLTSILKTVAESATRLCGARHGHIFEFDGEVLRFAAGYGTSRARIRRRSSRSSGRWGRQTRRSRAPASGWRFPGSSSNSTGGGSGSRARSASARRSPSRSRCVVGNEPILLQ